MNLFAPVQRLSIEIVYKFSSLLISTGGNDISETSLLFLFLLLTLESCFCLLGYFHLLISKLLIAISIFVIGLLVCFVCHK